MKKILIIMMLFPLFSIGQTAKPPTGCKMYMDDSLITVITKDAAIKWCELTPPTIKCDDGIIYKLETFKISFMSANPFRNQNFGVGQGGFPIRARQAVAGAKPDDTIILKEATYLDASGTPQPLPILSFKIL